MIGNDQAGIVHEVSSALEAQGASIERMTTATRDAAMSGGRLFEASISAIAPASLDPDAVRRALERLAGEIQVDVALVD